MSIGPRPVVLHGARRAARSTPPRSTAEPIVAWWRVSPFVQRATCSTGRSCWRPTSQVLARRSGRPLERPAPTRHPPPRPTPTWTPSATVAALSDPADTGDGRHRSPTPDAGHDRPGSGSPAAAEQPRRRFRGQSPCRPVRVLGRSERYGARRSTSQAPSAVAAVADAVVEAAGAALPELDLVDAEAPAAPEARARDVAALELGGDRGDPGVEVGATDEHVALR